MQKSDNDGNVTVQRMNDAAPVTKSAFDGKSNAVTGIRHRDGDVLSNIMRRLHPTPLPTRPQNAAAAATSVRVENLADKKPRDLSSSRKGDTNDAAAAAATTKEVGEINTPMSNLIKNLQLRNTPMTNETKSQSKQTTQGLEMLKIIENKIEDSLSTKRDEQRGGNDTSNTSNRSSSPMETFLQQLNSKYEKEPSDKFNWTFDQILKNTGSAKPVHRYGRGLPNNLNQLRTNDSNSVRDQVGRVDPRATRQARLGDQGRYDTVSRMKESHTVALSSFLFGTPKSELGVNSRNRGNKSDFLKSDTTLHTVSIPTHSLSLAEFSTKTRVKSRKIKRSLVAIGVMEKREVVDEDSYMIDPDTMELVLTDFDMPFRRVEKETMKAEEDFLMSRRALTEEQATVEGDKEYHTLPPRPPVVCIMGHVDHGKTTLMDALRRRAAGVKGDKEATQKKSKKKAEANKKNGVKGDVAGTEAGGITQVVTAFQVPLNEAGDGHVTFLDTPGHAAFKAMRRSGTDAADVIVLVVAADDGVSEQTVEIIEFYKSIAKGGGMTMVVALNKIDKHGIDVGEATRRVENQLLMHGIVSEGMSSSGSSEYGPPVQIVPVSGLTGLGLDKLIDGLVLQSEIMDLRADDTASCEGVVMDAKVDKGLGIVVDFIIRWGSLKKGDVVVSGDKYAKVRAIKDVNGKDIVKGLPSQPVRVIGFSEVPKSGEAVIVVESEAIAEKLVEKRKSSSSSAGENGDADYVEKSEAELQSAGKHLMQQSWREKFQKKAGFIPNDDDDNNKKVDNADEDDEEAKANRPAAGTADNPIRVPVIIRADADGTLAAIKESMIAIADDSTSVKILIDPIRLGVGPAQTADIQMAKECAATIICFNINTEKLVSTLAEEEGIKMLTNDVIYRLIEGAKQEFVRYLPKRKVDMVLGRAKVKAIYDIGGISSKVAGLEVTEGSLYKDKHKPKGRSEYLPCHYRVVRQRQVLTETDKLLTATSLKHFKEDVNDVGKGKDCGLALSNYNDYVAGDIVECYATVMEQKFDK